MCAAHEHETEYDNDKHNNSWCKYTLKSEVVPEGTVEYQIMDDSDAQAAQWAQWIEMQE